MTGFGPDYILPYSGWRIYLSTVIVVGLLAFHDWNWPRLYTTQAGAYI